MPTELSVNLNKIALIRNSRGRDFPSVASFARLALDSGAKGVTIHPRPDQRHATYKDIQDLTTLLAEYPDRELNIEGNPNETFMAHVLEARPDQCTLVPDADDQLTSDHGYDLTKQFDQIQPIVQQLKQAGIRVSVFMDPDPEQMPLAAKLGADRIELYTEAWAEAFDTEQQQSFLDRYRKATDAARAAGLDVNAGHDLNLHNLPAFLTIPGIDEVSIGHALTVEALEQGFTSVVRQYVDICSGSA
jgi:pyridoxine 5-phosphate synthase